MKFRRARSSYRLVRQRMVSYLPELPLLSVLSVLVRSSHSRISRTAPRENSSRGNSIYELSFSQAWEGFYLMETGVSHGNGNRKEKRLTRENYTSLLRPLFLRHAPFFLRESNVNPRQRCELIKRKGTPRFRKLAARLISVQQYKSRVIVFPPICPFFPLSRLSLSRRVE